MVSKHNAPHYQWGQECDGWHLLNSPTLSVIEENMPPQRFEKLHYHQFAQQVFYILQGEAEFLIDGQEYKIQSGESIHIKPNQVHRISNPGDVDLQFLVISQPRSHGDRINIE